MITPKSSYAPSPQQPALPPPCRRCPSHDGRRVHPSNSSCFAAWHLLAVPQPKSRGLYADCRHCWKLQCLHVARGRVGKRSWPCGLRHMCHTQKMKHVQVCVKWSLPSVYRNRWIVNIRRGRRECSRHRFAGIGVRPASHPCLKPPYSFHATSEATVAFRSSGLRCELWIGLGFQSGTIAELRICRDNRRGLTNLCFSFSRNAARISAKFCRVPTLQARPQ